MLSGLLRTMTSLCRLAFFRKNARPPLPSLRDWPRWNGWRLFGCARRRSRARELEARGAKAVISQHPRRLKRIAMRSKKTDRSFAAMIQLGAAVIASR